ncbi:FAD-binding domain-containing protein [Xylaria nigripes]|nr:FAD-binding domain-containing protein [Xylaria nigripes]
MTFLPSLQQHVSALTPALPLIKPTDSNFESTRACFVKRNGNVPGAIVRPQNVAHVQSLVQFCTKNSVNFVIRTGGHDCAGRSQVNGALSIDMRDIKHVSISADEKTATLGGGILTRDLAKALDVKGLITPLGTMGSVGYVGWATLGGYGIFSPRYGLGSDQIVGAKLVNAKGDVIVADAALLEGLRGGGGAFGVIVELTIKVYPLKQITTSMIVYESSDLKTAWTNYVTGYQKLTAQEALPLQLQVHPYGLKLPNLGTIFAVIAVWADEDHEEGKRWFNKIAGMGKCIMNDPQPTSASNFVTFNESMVVYGCYGRVYTLNLSKYTVKTAEVLAKYNALLPAEGITLSLHNYRASMPSAMASVFNIRQPHHMCEFIATTPAAEVEAEAAEWARNVMAEIRKVEPENVLEPAYVALLEDGELDLRKVYGSHYDTLVALKQKHDPQNVFKNTIPRLAV